MTRLFFNSRYFVGYVVALVAPVTGAAGDAESEDVVRSDQASATETVSELWLDPVFDAEIDFLIDEYGLSLKTATSRTHDALVVNDIRSLAREHPEVIDSWMTHYEEFLEIDFRCIARRRA